MIEKNPIARRIETVAAARGWGEQAAQALYTGRVDAIGPRAGWSQTGFSELARAVLA